MCMALIRMLASHDDVQVWPDGHIELRSEPQCANCPGDGSTWVDQVPCECCDDEPTE